jgi:hypothetical protein
MIDSAETKTVNHCLQRMPYNVQLMTKPAGTCCVNHRESPRQAPKKGRPPSPPPPFLPFRLPVRLGNRLCFFAAPNLRP